MRWRRQHRCERVPQAGRATSLRGKSERRGVAAHDAERDGVLGLDDGRAVALDDPVVARPQHDVVAVVFLREPECSLRDARPGRPAA